MSRGKVIVTGGAGFIGSHLVDRLLGMDYEVTVLDDLSTGRLSNLSIAQRSKNFTFIKTDITEFDKITRFFKDVDFVFHLAALADVVPSITEPMKYHRANVDGTIAVLEACRFNAVKKLVYTASSSCYGIPKNYPTTEGQEINPLYPYAFTKYVGEQYAFAWAKIYKLAVVSLRLFNVYGLRSRTSGAYGAVLGVFLAQKLAGKPFTIVGDGSQKRDFINVSDVADAFIKAAVSNVSNEIFNVGSGVPKSINELAKLLGGDCISVPSRPGEPDCTWADISKITKVLGWHPTISFEEGINRVLQNIDYWKDAPVWTPTMIESVTKEWFKYLAKG